MPIQLAVLTETDDGETRVALDPATAKRLANKGIRIRLQSGAGLGAYFSDASYAEYVSVAPDLAETLQGSQVVVKVQPPNLQQVQAIPEGAVLISFVYPHNNPQVVTALRDRQISTLAMELVPRITRAQAMDALSSQATISGYKAVLMGAQLSSRLFPMLTTAAGTLRPARVVVIGAGVAGLQAIATARRLGAQVEAYDIRPAAREQVESLGAKMIDTGVNAEGEGGYARELNDTEIAAQAQALKKHLAQSHVVIATAAIPGRPAPKIITEDMVAAMLAGTVIVDLAAESGGNCVLTQPGKTVHHEHKIIHGPLNAAASGAVHASEMFARNIANLLELVLATDELIINTDDEIIAGCLLTHQGDITHAPSQELIEGVH